MCIRKRTRFCNNEDDDCDGTIDESDALSFITWYEDLDGDGYGNRFWLAVLNAYSLLAM